MVTTGAMPVSPSLSGRPATQAGTPPVEVLAPVRPSPLDYSRGPVKGVLCGAVVRALRKAGAWACRAASGRANLAAKNAHAHVSEVAGRSISLHARTRP